jgi:hypothetical protein
VFATTPATPAEPLAPTPVATPLMAEPVAAAPAPAPAPVAPVAAPTAFRLAVVAELDNGSKLELATFDDFNAAREFALQVMRAIAHATDEWPLVGGRFVRPSSVVSIEITALM